MLRAAPEGDSLAVTALLTRRFDPKTIMGDVSVFTGGDYPALESAADARAVAAFPNPHHLRASA